MDERKHLSNNKKNNSRYDIQENDEFSDSKIISGHDTLANQE